MVISDLNSRYGAPGRIVFHEGYAGYPNVVLANKYGTAEVSLLGATVMSYRPTGQGPVLFHSAKRDGEYNRGDDFHGGVPLCWPQFGRRFSDALPQHGFARKMLFEVRATEYSEEMTEITLGLKSTDETKKLWNHDFDLEVKVSVSMKLNLSAKTVNTGKEPLSFSCGYHPYFLVRERNADVKVRGLDGCKVVDATVDPIREGVQAGDVVMDRGYDHIFAMKPAPKHEYAILDGGLRRAIAIAASGNDNTVVWNPDTAYVVAGHEADDWRRFVCVEPVSDWPGGRTLKPGESYELKAAIQSILEN